MQVIVDKHTVTIQKNEIVNEGEYNVQSCNFQFTSDYDGLPKFAIFKTDTVTKQIALSGNSCITPEEVLQSTGIVGLGVYAYETDGDNLVLRYSPTPAVFTVEPGSYDEGDTPTPPTPSVIEQLQEEITQNANNISSLQELTATHTSQISDIQNDVSDIKVEQITQNSNIQTNTNDISDIKAEQITQNQNIQTNANNISTLQNDLSDEVLNRQNADNNLQSQIDAITVSSDVVDVVGTYQDLQNYDTQHIKENDIIKVLQDSTHSNSMSYYRWVITDHVGAWVYVGSEGPYYTKSETDVLLQGKADSDDVYTKSEVYNKTETDNLLNGKQNTLTFDTTPTENSTNPVTSGGIYVSQAEQNTQIDALNNLVNQLPTVDGTGTDISLENTVDYKMRKLDIFGNSSQNTNIITYTCSGTETGDYYYVYNNTNYQFTMPTISSGDVIYFNTTDLKLYLGNTQITTTTDNTGTLITMRSTPNPYYQQFIKVLTGNKYLYFQNENLIVGNLEIVKSKNTNGEWNGNSYTYRGVTFTYNEDKSITIKGTSTGAIYFLISDDYPLNSNTNYTLLNQIGITPAGLQIQNLFSNLGTGYQYGTLQPNNQVRKFTTGTVTGLNNTKLIVASGTTIDTTVYPMLVKGSIISNIPDYVVSQLQAYPLSFGTMEFCSIPNGNIRDKIVGNPNNWFKRQRVKKIILTGQELFKIHATTNTFMRVRTDENIYNDLIDGGSSYCDYFENDNTAGAISAINGFRIAYISGKGQIWFVLDINEFDELSDFTSWLQTKYANNTPVIVYSPLIEAIDVPITDTTLVNQLNNIYNNAYSYSGTTNITSTFEDGNEQMVIDASALLDLNSLITRIETIESEV